ncbi:discoidin domain-containing protein [Lewinella sp. IMCC34191]|uniref:discoidin domain-containing protein n=1 Tax=Lewinella sp. IMCC34191 TaxID=2259172 RepID=UPI0018E4E9AE|nr:discoidin domain-containing protein [Lewinella sp. IMCC34191]
MLRWVGSATLFVLLCLGRPLAAQGTIDLARNRSATASSSRGGNAPGHAFDGVTNTRWESVQQSDPEWLYVDLGATYQIDRVLLTWEGAYGKDYLIQLSDDAVNWVTVRSVTGNSQLINNLTGLDTEGRYVRMYGTARGTSWGYSLYAFEVYATEDFPTVRLTAPADGDIFAQGSAITLTAEALPVAGKTITEVAYFAGSTLIGTATTAPYTFNWAGASGGSHTLSARAIDSDGITAVSDPVLINVSLGNLALNAPAVASTNTNIADRTFDGDIGTRWESVHGMDPSWIYVDLGKEYNLEQIRLTWETAYAAEYRMEISNDASSWAIVATRTNGPRLGDNLVNNFTGLDVTARYVRMYGTVRSTEYGYSLREFEVYGSEATHVITTPDRESVHTAPATVELSVDGSVVSDNVTRIDLLLDGALIDSRTASPFAYTVPISNLATGNYAVEARVYHDGGRVSGFTPVQIYVVPATEGSQSCGEAVTLTASGAPSGGSYRWYNVPTGGTPIAGATAASYTTPPIDFTRTYYVSAVDADGEESRRAQVTASYLSLSQASTTGLTSAFPFHGNPDDATGQGNDGIVSGATLVADRFGRENSAYSFDGVDDYITTSTSFPADIEGTNEFSISLWFNTSTTRGGKLLGMGTSQTGASNEYDRHIYMNNAGQLYFGIYLGDHLTINTTESFNDGLWHNVVTTLSSDGIELYVDGELKASDASVTEGQKYGSVGYWRIGYDNLQGWPDRPANDHFEGVLDDVNLYYSTKLSPGDLTDLYGASVDTVSIGETIELKATFLEGVNYAWTGPRGFTSTDQNPTIPGAIPENAGIYSVAVSNGSCTSEPVSVNAVVIGSAVLPVELFYFEGNVENQQVHLSWGTMIDESTRGFEVERSSDGSHFEKIGFVLGGRDLFGSQDYTFTDAPPSSGTVYYRLRQVDNDGGYAYSRVLSYRLSAQVTARLFPNPVHSGATLKLQGLSRGTITLEVIDARSLRVFREEIAANAVIAHNLNFGTYAPGIYWLLIKRDGQILDRIRVVKQ